MMKTWIRSNIGNNKDYCTDILMVNNNLSSLCILFHHTDRTVVHMLLNKEQKISLNFTLWNNITLLMLGRFVNTTSRVRITLNIFYCICNKNIDRFCTAKKAGKKKLNSSSNFKMCALSALFYTWIWPPRFVFERIITRNIFLKRNTIGLDDVVYFSLSKGMVRYINKKWRERNCNVLNKYCIGYSSQGYLRQVKYLK
jgi:hypothetical protein